MAEVEKIVSPKGMLEWVFITGEGKPNMSGKMQYTANVVLDPKVHAEHAEFLKKIDAYWEANKPKGFKGTAKSLGYYLYDLVLDKNGEPVLDDKGKKTYNPDGKVYLAFKTGTSYKDGSPKEIKIYNAKAKRVALGATKIGNGSIGHISGAMGVYENRGPKGNLIDAGVTLYLDAIQITKLVPYEGGDAGFAADTDDEEAWTGEDDTFTGESTDGTAQPRL